MPMNVRKSLLILCLALLPWPVSALENAPIYVIQKGDTLWGISEQFLKDPYYWPSLWSHNPAITNPHLVYPGQTVRIIGGRVQIVPAYPAATDAAAATPTAPAPLPTAPVTATPPVTEAVTIRAGSRLGGFIGTDELRTSGVLVDTVDNRLLMAAGDQVFLEMTDLPAARAGDTFSLYSIGRIVNHPATGAPVGNRVEELGTVRIVAKNAQVATGVIADSFREIQRGARLRPFTQPPQKIALKKGRPGLTGYLIAGGDDKLALGQYDIIYLDLGSRDGLEVGNLLNITRTRQASEFGLQSEAVVLPDILLGSAVVLEARPRTASALVLKVAQPLFIGDRIVTQTE